MGTSYQQKTFTLSLFGFVLFFVFLAFSPSLDNDFVNWDDDVHVTDNPFIYPLNGRQLMAIFSTTVNRIYIPLTELSFAIEAHLLGFAPFIYHLNNLLLHLGVTAGIFVLAGRLGLSAGGAAVAALVFGLHPMHVQSVAWVTERKDVLYSFFYMAALLCYLAYLRKEKEVRTGQEAVGLCASGKIFFYLTFLLGFLSALAKPMALSLPLILFVLDWFERRPFSWRLVWEKAMMGSLLAPVVWMTYALHVRSPGIPLLEAWLTWIWCFIFYLRKFFVPDEFLLFYQFPAPVSLANPEFALALGTGILVVMVVVLFRRDRFFLLAWFFYFGSIFFLLRFDRVADTDMVADRFMYLPSVGFCLWLGAVYQRYRQRWQKILSKKLALWLLTGGLLLALTVKTNRQCDIWQSGVSLWRHQLDKEPKVASALVYHQLAVALIEEPAFQQRGEGHLLPEIFRLLHQALVIKPDYAQAHYSLASLYHQLGDTQQAHLHLIKALEADPAHFEAFYLLGIMYHQHGQSTQAVKAFQRAISINPDNRRLVKRIYTLYTAAGLTGKRPQVYDTQMQHLEQIYHLP
jgi:tetratricopeptide (TPR) repeat protein